MAHGNRDAEEHARGTSDNGLLYQSAILCLSTVKGLRLIAGFSEAQFGMWISFVSKWMLIFSSIHVPSACQTLATNLLEDKSSADDEDDDDDGWLLDGCS